MLSKNLIKLIRSLEMKKFRKESGLFVAEGEKIVFDLIAAGMECVKLIATKRFLASLPALDGNEIIETDDEKYGNEVADNTSILYGGSCKPSNAKELFANPNVDGGLIGGAALKVADFKGIIDAFK